jgi:hypothetical protein
MSYGWHMVTPVCPPQQRRMRPRGLNFQARKFISGSSSNTEITRCCTGRGAHTRVNCTRSIVWPRATSISLYRCNCELLSEMFGSLIVYRRESSWGCSSYRSLSSMCRHSCHRYEPGVHAPGDCNLVGESFRMAFNLLPDAFKAAEWEIYFPHIG